MAPRFMGIWCAEGEVWHGIDLFFGMEVTRLSLKTKKEGIHKSGIGKFLIIVN